MEEIEDLIRPQPTRARLPGSEPDLFISTSSRDGETVEVLNETFAQAAFMGASDVHFEDGLYETRIRVRIHGKMHEVKKIPRTLGRDINSKIRMRAKLSLSEIRKPLDGRFSLIFEDYDIALDVRVSIQPTVHGASIVCRLLDQRNTSRRIDEIRMSPGVREWIDILIHEPHGLFLVTCHTGSGKTTTLYAILNELNDDSRKIVTIEDPVEYRVPGLVQTNIEAGLTFAEVLRETLRQDPDVVLVGEIRDAETASIAVQAAMTGHLVLSTLHANDACQTAVRMMDLGVDPNTLGAALRGILAQRLVRKLDEENSSLRPPNEFEQKWLLNNQAGEIDALYGVPNAEDSNYGYTGRLPVMELLVVDRLVRNVLPLRDAKLIRSVAKGQPQYRTLAQAGAELSRQGMTSLSEIFAITSVTEVMHGARSLGERLVEMGRITPYQLQVIKEQMNEDSKVGVVSRIEDILIRGKYCTREDIDEAEIV